MENDEMLIPRDLISETKIFESKDSMQEVIKAVKKYSAAIITKDGEYHGIIDSRALYRRGSNTQFYDKESAEKFTVRAGKITRSTRVGDAIYYFYKTRLTALPFVDDKGDIVGILKRSTLMKILLSLGDLNGIKAENAMTSPILAIDDNSSISQTKAYMKDHNVNRLAVIREGSLVGIITNHDILNKHTVSGERLPEMRSNRYDNSDIQINSIMNSNPITIDNSKSLADAVRLMIDNHISSVIVTKRSDPIGVLTPINVLESALAKRRIGQDEIFISGLDSSTYEYEDELNEMLRSFLDKVDKMKNLSAEYITLRVKKVKGRRYEIHARLALKKKGIISASSSGFMLDRTVNDLLDKLKKDILKEKEKIIGLRKVDRAE